MKTVYNNQALAHIWASNNVPEGRNPGNTFFFNENGIYSYGKHFMIAKRHNDRTVVMTLQRYSNSTAKQMSYVLRAISHLNVVYCQDPEASVIWNKRAALDKLDEALSGLEKKGIRQTTKDKIRAQAHHIATQFNEYYAAVGGDCGPIELGEDFVEQYKKMQEQERAAKQKKIEQAALETKERLEAWKQGETVPMTGFHNHPVALRIHASRGSYDTGGLLPDPGSVGRDAIQTSHGAEIPVRYAPRLWTMIEEVKASGEAKYDIDFPLGHYRLNTINADGSLVVGCHEISYQELERQAKILGYLQS